MLDAMEIYEDHLGRVREEYRSGTIPYLCPYCSCRATVLVFCLEWDSWDDWDRRDDGPFVDWDSRICCNVHFGALELDIEGDTYARTIFWVVEL